MPGMTSLFSVSLCPLAPPALFFQLVLIHTELEMSAHAACVIPARLL